jgi:anthranilate synthase component 1
MFPQSKEDFVKLATEVNLIPVYEEYSAALETPLSAFLKLKKGSYAFILESVEGGMWPGRYSFIGFEASRLFEAKDRKVKITDKNKTISYDSCNPLQELQSIFQGVKPLKIPEFPVFCGGAVGYLGYDMARYWENLPKAGGKDTGYPDCFFMFADTLVIFDHVKQTIKIVINVPVSNDPGGDYTRAVLKIRQIRSILDKPVPEVPAVKDNPSRRDNYYSYNCTPDQFQEMVRKAKEYIRDGDIFQVVLSQKMKFELQAEPLAVYNCLRSLNPSPYMFFLSFGDIQMVGSSPEVMVRVEDGFAELRPIAGTRPRGRTGEEDKKLAEELLADEKERAEHLMLVDLGRNDLGRVSEYGSVKVKGFMHIELYSHVMHIVSRVTGKLKKGKSCFDVLRASFPAVLLPGHQR